MAKGIFLTIVKRECALAARALSEVFQSLFFFAIVVTLVPLGIGAEPNLLRSVAPGVIWVGALLAALLSLPRLYSEDYKDGTLEQMILAKDPLVLIVLGKIVAHWLLTGVPLTIFSLVFSLMFDLQASETMTLFFGLLMGTPVLSAIGSIGASLTLGVRSSGVLTSLLVLPLYVPVLIFGAGAVSMVSSGLDPSSHSMMVGALSLFSMALAPWVSAMALKISY